MSYPFLIQGKNIIIVIDNVIHTINDSHLNYTKILDALKKKTWKDIVSLVDVAKQVAQYSNGNVKLVNGAVYWKEEELHSSLTTHMLGMYEDGIDISPLVNFMENLMENPAKHAIDELYGFLEKSKLPLTPDGHFLAYKKVKSNYKDVYTGTIDNSVGKVVTMARDKVNSNRDQTCSTGLHFCSLSYLNEFSGERVVILKINPKDVVSIPSDYNNAKGRACRYEVIGEVGKDGAEKEFTKSVQVNGNSTPTQQEYDSRGRALSMTPNAIRKRAKAKGVKPVATPVKQVTPVPTKSTNVKQAVTKSVSVKQDYDAKGRPLSMTPDAIRKRKARQNKANKV